MGEVTLSITDVLAVVEEFGEASIELVAWERCVTVGDVQDAWRHAIDEGLLRAVRRDPSSGEVMHVLTPAGRRRQPQTTQ